MADCDKPRVFGRDHADTFELKEGVSVSIANNLDVETVTNY